jgi:aminoglycoside phosphotransferase (APT) family kinase protein
MPTAAAALRSCARVAAALHRPVPDSFDLRGTGLGDRTRSAAREIDRLLTETEALARFAPGLASTLSSHLGALRTDADSSPLPLALAHGDLTLSEVLLDGPISSLFDLDAACLAEPAFDLGHFTARLGLAGRRAAEAAGVEGHRRVRELERGFLDAYAEARPDLDTASLAGRTDIYQVTSLVDLVLRSWWRLKPDRLALSLTLLQEELPGRRASSSRPGQKDSLQGGPRSKAIDRR